MPPKKAAIGARKASAKDASTTAKSNTVAIAKVIPEAASGTKAARATKATASTTTAASKKRKVTEEPNEDSAANLPAAKKSTANLAMATAKTPTGKSATKKSPASPGAKRTAAPTNAGKTTSSANTKKNTTTTAAKAASKADESDKENEGAPVQAASRKRKSPVEASADGAEDQEGEDDEQRPPPKKSKKTAAPKERAVKKPAIRRRAAVINQPPTDILDVFVFGEGSAGELGLGSVKVDGKKPRDVKRPRLNANLSATTTKVVQIACGGMHVAALTADNKILTWGVNDLGALGRDTTWDGGLRDADADSDDEDDDDTGMNPHESTPGEVDMSGVEPDTVFVQVVASDSATFALTTEGRVYGWGTFRNDEGILGFDKNTLVQKTPRLMDKPVEKITQLAAGANHVLALDSSGKVLTWGSGQHDQLGRKTIVKRGSANNRFTGEEGLTPAGIGALPIKKKRGEAKAVPVKVACGAYHSFILDNEGRLYSWGLNNYGELGNMDEAGEANASSPQVRLVDSLSAHKIADIDGGEHHSLACTDDGKLITWGRIDGHQVGLTIESFTEETAIFDDHKRPRILKVPTVVPNMPFIKFVAGGTDHNFALTKDGKAYSWGFSANFQTGQGTDKDIEIPTVIDNTAVRGKKLIFAGAGGQYSVLASVAEAPDVNGSV